MPKDEQSEEQVNVLFVCTGNKFRSPSAEYLLRKYLSKNDEKNINVKSAGTITNPGKVRLAMKKALATYNIDIRSHKQTKLSKELIDWSDVIIAMADYNQKFIADTFSTQSYLYNELTTSGFGSINDVEDALSPSDRTKKNISKHVTKIIQYIHDSIPEIAKSLQEKTNNIKV